MNRAHMIQPCENCPYRKDAPRKLWHRSEFEGVLSAERERLGKIYNCHKHSTLPIHERGLCAGWLLDQKKRNFPSISLRIMLIREPSARDAVARVSSGGLKLFRTVQAMCRANGVRS